MRYFISFWVTINWVRLCHADIDVLNRLMQIHGVLCYPRLDNRPEFVSKAPLEWTVKEFHVDYISEVTVQSSLLH